MCLENGAIYVCCSAMCGIHHDLRGARPQEALGADERIFNTATQVSNVKVLERIEQARINPPSPGWDGVTAFDTK